MILHYSERNYLISNSYKSSDCDPISKYYFKKNSIFYKKYVFLFLLFN